MPSSQFSLSELAVFVTVPVSFSVLLLLLGYPGQSVPWPDWLPRSFATFGAVAFVFIVSSFGSFTIVFGKVIDWYRGRT